MRIRAILTRTALFFITLALMLATAAVVLAQNELTTNPGFESGVGAPWSSDEGVISAGTVKHSGAASAKLVTDGGANIYQCVKWISGTNTYVALGGWINLQSANIITASLTIYSFSDKTCSDTNNGESSLGGLYPALNRIGSWQQVWTGPVGDSHPFPVPENTQSLMVVFSVFQSNNSPATAYLDDVTVYSSSPTAVTLSNLDARQPAEAAPLWPLIIAVPLLLLGAGFLVLRRRRA